MYLASPGVYKNHTWTACCSNPGREDFFLYIFFFFKFIFVLVFALQIIFFN